MAFVLAAALVGELARRGNDRRVLGTVGPMAAGNALIRLIGTAWLAPSPGPGAEKAIAAGGAPFLVTAASGLRPVP